MSKNQLNKDLAGVSDVALGKAEKQGIGNFVSGLSAGDGYREDDHRPVRQGAGRSQGGKQSQTQASWNKGGGLGSGRRPGSAAKAERHLPMAKYNADQTDKIYDLERENTSLKLKENLLESEIVKMRTKLRRIDELMKKKRSTSAGAQTALPAEVHRQLEDEINKIGGENDAMKQRNKKLRAIEKELSVKQVTKKAPINKFSHVKGKLQNTRMKQSDQDFLKLVEDLKVQLVQGERQIITLTTQRDQMQHRMPNQNQGSLQMELDSQQKELTDINRRCADIKSNLARDEALFAESRQLIERKQQDIQDLGRECETLAHKNFQISIKAQQAAELTEDLTALRSEREALEKSITQITSLPFTRNQSGEPSTVQRAAQLELRLAELTRERARTQAEEQAKWNDVQELKAKAQKLAGENDVVKAQHQEARSKFIAANGEVTDADVHRDLFKMDKTKYAEAMGDLVTKPESQPIWRDYDFLDRNTSTQHVQSSNDVKYLKNEAVKMKHENRDFAAELDKAQSLLKLQTDIERENRLYHEQERERLKLLSQSSHLKAQEMAKRVDGQGKLLKEMRQKLGLERGSSSSPPRAGAGGQEDPGRSDALSDFSVDANDFEGAQDENFLDLRVIDGTLDQAMIESCLRSYGAGMSAPKDAMTLVSVAFYDHDTRATQLAQGYRPQYRSQISFRNKMDAFYVQYLSKNKIKLEVHLAGVGKEALPLGTCEALLSDLVYGETFSDSRVGETAIVERHLNILPAPGLSTSASQKTGGTNLASQILGTLRIKMRLRKPIQEALRYHRDMAGVRDTTRAATTAAGRPGSAAAQKQVVTIQVVSCRDLKCNYGDVSQMAPFFHYQFFTFPERLSHTAGGSNPTFQDSQSYTMNFDDGTMKYLESQPLTIVVFDDNAPMTGIERGGQSSGAGGDDVDDLIGTCRISLADLAKGIGINGDFDIRGLHNESRGKMTVKITVVDPAASTAGNRAQAQKDIQNAQKQSYTASWERDIVRRIAAKLGRLAIDVELMFGVFSRGTRSCTREDFKYCCLRRLNLKDQLSEKELDMLLEARLKDQPNMDQKQFVEIFSSAIGEARNEAQNQEAMDRTLTMRYNDAMKQRDASGTLGAGQGNATAGGRTWQGNATGEGGTLMDFVRKDAVNVLVSCILKSSYEQINREVTKMSKYDKISSDDLRKALSRVTGASDFEVQKVTKLIAIDGGVFVIKFVSLLDEALLDARFNSQAVSKFNQIIQAQGKVLSESFASKDINNDGCLNLDGFKSAVLGASELSDYRLTLGELTEIFNLVSQNVGPQQSTMGKRKYGEDEVPERGFLYAEYVMEIDPRNKQYFPKLNFSERDSRLEESSITMEHNRSFGNVIGVGKSSSPDLTRNQSMGQTASQGPNQAGGNWNNRAGGAKSAALASAASKIERFLIQQDVTLSTLFQVIDSNSDSQLGKAEFKPKMRGLHMGLEEEELEAMFNDLDVNKDGHISYNEFISQFTAVNTAQLVKRIRKILYGARISAELIYNQHCSGSSMTRNEFKALVSALIDDKLADVEIQSIFDEILRELEKILRVRPAAIPKEQFLQWFGQDEQEKVFQIGIEDITKPLATCMARKNLTVTELFARYDQNKNQMMSAPELKVAAKELLSFDMTPEEVATMHEFFRAKFRRSEVRRAEFAELINKQSVRKYDSKAATTALARVKAELRKSNRNIEALLTAAAQKEFPGLVNLRAFKLTVFTLGILTQPQVNNLAKYMDRRNDGMIQISEVALALDTDRYSPIAPPPDKGSRSKR